MRFICQEKARSMIDEYGTLLNCTVNDIINELKSGSKNYGEVEERLVDLKREFLCKKEDKRKFSSLFDVVEEIIEKEKNEMPLTDRSFLVVEELKPIACNFLSDEDIKRIVKEIEQKIYSIVESGFSLV